MAKEWRRRTPTHLDRVLLAFVNGPNQMPDDPDQARWFRMAIQRKYLERYRPVYCFHPPKGRHEFFWRLTPAGKVEAARAQRVMAEWIETMRLRIAGKI